MQYPAHAERGRYVHLLLVGIIGDKRSEAERGLQVEGDKHGVLARVLGEVRGPETLGGGNEVGGGQRGDLLA